MVEEMAVPRISRSALLRKSNTSKRKKPKTGGTFFQLPERLSRVPTLWGHGETTTNWLNAGSEVGIFLEFNPLQAACRGLQKQMSRALKPSGEVTFIW